MTSNVVAVIWTYNRFELAAQCVRAVRAQSHAPSHIVVVDSASPDDSSARLSTMFPDVEVIRLPSNDGPGAALACAIQATQNIRPDYYWLVEDDSLAAADCLEAALTLAAPFRRLGILGPVGCDIVRGQWHATPPLSAGELRPVDFVVLDGALVSAEAVRRAGLPRTDYFIMMVDVEYPLRIATHGFAMVQAGLPYEQLRLGSAAADSTWRYYYQTRNHLRMALTLRSPRLFGGFILRTTKHLAHATMHGEWRAIRLRASGLRDGILGRMGRTLEPPGSP